MHSELETLHVVHVIYYREIVHFSHQSMVGPAWSSTLKNTYALLIIVTNHSIKGKHQALISLSFLQK